MVNGVSIHPRMTAVEAAAKVRNVFCVGRNYRNHAIELGNDVPTRPLIFGKSTHAVVPAAGKVVLPEGRNNVHHELEIVLWMKSLYRPGISLSDMVQGIALGLDLTDRDAQSELKAKGQPWEFAKGFPGSAVLSDVYAVEDWDAFQDATFSLKIDEQTVQMGCPKDMLFSFQTLIDYVGTHFGLDAGDVLYTGTPAGVGPLQRGNVLQLLLGDTRLAYCTIG